jgi:membrane protein YqaA with SNARE-associated domain
MSRFVARIEALALALGAPGLVIVAFLDSSFLSLPEIIDILLIWMVMQHKARLPLYALAATAGSIAGCLVMYYIGRGGGEVLVRKRFHPASVDRATGAFRRYGLMAVLIPSILPPPAPFKIFVIMAGVADIGVGRFVLAIVIGRGFRYFSEGLLAVWYGDRALAFLRQNGQMAALVLATLMAACVAGYMVWRKAQAGSHR